MARQSIEQARDPLLRHSMAALRRSARRARNVALATHTALIVASNGNWRRIDPAQVRETGAGYEVSGDNIETDRNS